MRRALAFGSLFALHALCGVTGTPSSAGYWTSACLTPDGSELALGGDRTAWVDVATGRITPGHRHDHDAVVCPPDGRALGLGSRGATVLHTDATEPGSGLHPWTVVGVRSRGELVLTLRTAERNRSTLEYREPRRFAVATDHGVRAEAIVLSPAALGLTDPAPSVLSPPIGLLGDGQVLVAAGSTQGTDSSAHFDIGPWRFHRVDPSTGDAVPVGPERPSRRAAYLRYFDAGATVPSGDLAAVAWRGDGDGSLEVFETEQVERRCEAPTGDREVEALAFDPAGARLAMAVTSAGGQRARVRVIDTADCRTVYEGPEREGRVFFVAFLPDGGSLWARSDQRVERASATGELIYSVAAE
ncbi:MAG: hypothetical protein H6719_04795 [Sandaracinaceae bacterium]|nr:hypothetical protein [Sandaracinaceae bacterium]